MLVSTHRKPAHAFGFTFEGMGPEDHRLTCLVMAKQPLLLGVKRKRPPPGRQGVPRPSQFGSRNHTARKSWIRASLVLSTASLGPSPATVHATNSASRAARKLYEQSVSSYEAVPRLSSPNQINPSATQIHSEQQFIPYLTYAGLTANLRSGCARRVVIRAIPFVPPSIQAT